MHARILTIITYSFLLLNLMLSKTSYALERPFPTDAKLGTFSPSAKPKIVIDGDVRQLTAAAQIRNQQNVIVMPMSLSGDDVKVLYKENGQGRIDRIWMLTPEEEKNYTPQKVPMKQVPVKRPMTISTPAQVTTPAPLLPAPNRTATPSTGLRN